MDARYVADTRIAHFLREKFGPKPNLRGIQRASDERGIRILASTLSELLLGRETMETETLRRLAILTETPEEEIAALLARDPRRGRHKPGLGPTGDAEANATALLQGIAEKVEAMYRAFDRGEMIGAWASPEPPTLDAELAVMTEVTPEDRSRLIPVSVADNREARELPLASVVWIDPGGEPHPGKVVLVQKAGVKRLKKYEPGDDVIGVGRLVQWTLP